MTFYDTKLQRGLRLLVHSHHYTSHADGKMEFWVRGELIDIRSAFHSKSEEHETDHGWRQSIDRELGSLLEYSTKNYNMR